MNEASTEKMTTHMLYVYACLGRDPFGITVKKRCIGRTAGGDQRAADTYRKNQGKHCRIGAVDCAQLQNIGINTISKIILWATCVIAAKTSVTTIINTLGLKFCTNGISLSVV